MYNSYFFYKRRLFKVIIIEPEYVYKKILSSKIEEETALIKIEANGILNKKSKVNSVEIFVLEGTYINEFGEFSHGTYLRL